MDADHHALRSYRDAIDLGCAVTDDEAEAIRARDQQAAIALHAALHRRRPLRWLVAIASAAWLQTTLRWRARHQPAITPSDTPTQEPTT